MTEYAYSKKDSDISLKTSISTILPGPGGRVGCLALLALELLVFAGGMRAILS
jgi:hypothetical protein